MRNLLAVIAYETAKHYVIPVDTGFEIYRMESTAAVRCARCGYKGQRGLDWCKAEIARREA